MRTASELLHTYLDVIHDPHAAAGLFAEDGVVELPYLASLGLLTGAKGRTGIEAFIASLLSKMTNYAFKDVRLLIETPEQVFGEYEVEAVVNSTAKPYRQMYAGRLVAAEGRIVLLRESLDTVVAQRAFSPEP